MPAPCSVNLGKRSLKVFSMKPCPLGCCLALDLVSTKDRRPSAEKARFRRRLKQSESRVTKCLCVLGLLVLGCLRAAAGRTVVGSSMLSRSSGSGPRAAGQEQWVSSQSCPASSCYSGPWIALAGHQFLGFWGKNQTCFFSFFFYLIKLSLNSTSAPSVL